MSCALHFYYFKDAANTYYKTLSQEDSLTRRGKAAARRLIQKHRERMRRAKSNIMPVMVNK